EGKKKQNCKCVRYSVNGECRVLLVATRDIAKGERLYYDYNGYEHEYPTHHFMRICCNITRCSVEWSKGSSNSSKNAAVLKKTGEDMTAATTTDKGPEPMPAPLESPLSSEEWSKGSSSKNVAVLRKTGEDIATAITKDKVN
ncbi:hypothetical protein Goari_019463, partial [Gossypium aridum]|nr:hypothetical protein [Gossypium aridum]